MPLMNEAPANAAGATVEISVIAPNGKVRAPLVKLQRQIAGRVGEIEADHTALLATETRNAGHIEGLAGSVVHASQEDQRDVLSGAVDQRLDVFVANAAFAFVRGQ